MERLIAWQWFLGILLLSKQASQLGLVGRFIQTKSNLEEIRLKQLMLVSMYFAFGALYFVETGECHYRILIETQLPLFTERNT